MKAFVFKATPSYFSKLTYNFYKRTPNLAKWVTINKTIYATFILFSILEIIINTRKYEIERDTWKSDVSVQYSWAKRLPLFHQISFVSFLYMFTFDNFNCAICNQIWTLVLLKDLQLICYSYVSPCFLHEIFFPSLLGNCAMRLYPSPIQMPFSYSIKLHPPSLCDK